jgi:antitoxin MazE
MHTHIETCASGLAILVPEPLAKKAGLRPGAPAELEWTDGKWLARSETLAELLAGITPENLHAEQFSGPPMGAELL